MVNGNDILEYTQENIEKLWNNFCNEHLKGLNPLSAGWVIDVDEVFKEFPKVQECFDEYCVSEYSEEGL